MKYYCIRCESELKTEAKNYGGYCPICYDCKDGLITQLCLIPDYETPAQYEKRTGKQFPDKGAVFVKCDGTQYQDNGDEYDQCVECPFSVLWELTDFNTAKFYTSDSEDICSAIYVIADPPIPPPDGWKPEEEEKQ